jgi:hypothetical protein
MLTLVERFRPHVTIVGELECVIYGNGWSGQICNGKQGKPSLGAMPSQGRGQRIA